MIASLQGTIASKAVDHVVLVVGGVGFKVFVAAGAVSANVGDDLYLHTLLIVREDALTLYGFPNPAERTTFEQLTSVSGVGARMALSIMGALTADRLHAAVAGGQPELLTRVPGIGKKTAEKIVFELKDKLKGGDGLIAVSSFSDVNKDVLDALVSFGYSLSEAQAAVRALPPDTPNDFEERMRRALQYFANG